MPTKQEMDELFPAMVSTFQPANAVGVNAVIQFNLSGDAGGKWWVKIEEGTAVQGEGAVDSPAMTMSMTADDFYSLMKGKLNPMQAFMMGKLKVDNTNLGLKMMQMFKMG